MTPEVRGAFRALELPETASLEDARASWRTLVKVWHPDRFSNDLDLQRQAQERLKNINGAYETLQRYFDSPSVDPGYRTGSSHRRETNRDTRTGQSAGSAFEKDETPPPPPRASSSSNARTSYTPPPSAPFMKPLWKRILISVVLLTAAYFGGRILGIIETQPEVVQLVWLDDFMGMKNFPVHGVILSKRPSYIKIRLENGRVIEHSGGYSLWER